MEKTEEELAAEQAEAAAAKAAADEAAAKAASGEGEGDGDGDGEGEGDGDGDGEKELEPWQAEDDEDDNGDNSNMPVAAHIKMKQKLKGRIGEKDDKISELEQQVLDLRNKISGKPEVTANPNDPALSFPAKPSLLDFETDADYEKAIEVYEDQVATVRYNRIAAQQAQQQTVKAHVEKQAEAVDNHYERAAKLISESGIDAKVYTQADSFVRSSIESVMPKRGDKVVDQLITLMGEGSEKVIYFLGRNKNALATVKAKLAEDPSGMKAAIYIGEQKNRLLSPAKKNSSANSPARKLKGDEDVPAKAGALKREYEQAHGKGNLQKAYNAKKKARAAGVDVSKW